MRGHQPAQERDRSDVPATGPAARPAVPSVAAALALQRTAGNAAVTAMIQRVPRPPASRRRDTSQLEVVPKPPAGPRMDYLEYVRNEPWDDEKMWAWTNPSAGWNLLATWILFDAQDRVVHQDAEPPGNETLPFAVVKRHVEKHGPGALGEWTMRLEKDEYYDDHRFAVTAEEEKPGAPMAGRTTPSYFNVREMPSTTARVLAKLETDWVGPMTDLFLEWLERLVKETGAFVPPGESEPAEASGGP